MWRLPLLQSHGAKGARTDPAIGGTPGLTIGLASELAQATGGTVDLEELALDDGLTEDGTVEQPPFSGAEYRIVLRLPLG